MKRTTRGMMKAAFRAFMRFIMARDHVGLAAHIESAEKIQGGYHYNHAGVSGTFKKNRRKALKQSRRRKMKPAAR